MTLDILPINFVDANNNHVFDRGLDVPLVQGELEDGVFTTAKAEGGYAASIAGAGLMINVSVETAGDLHFSAAGDLVVTAAPDADRDIQLRGSAVLRDDAVAAGRNLSLDAAGRIAATGAPLFPGRDLSLKADGQDGRAANNMGTRS